TRMALGTSGAAGEASTSVARSEASGQVRELGSAGGDPGLRSGKSLREVTPDGRTASRIAALQGALRGIGSRYGEMIRARYPRIPRRVSGYNLDELLPENGFNLARA